MHTREGLECKTPMDEEVAVIVDADSAGQCS